MEFSLKLSSDDLLLLRNALESKMVDVHLSIEDLEDVVASEDFSSDHPFAVDLVAERRLASDLQSLFDRLCVMRKGGEPYEN